MAQRGCTPRHKNKRSEQVTKRMVLLPQELPASTAHGSAVLAAGDTQVLAAVTVGTLTDARVTYTLLGTETSRLITIFACPSFASGAVRSRALRSHRNVGA